MRWGTSAFAMSPKGPGQDLRSGLLSALGRLPTLATNHVRTSEKWSDSHDEVGVVNANGYFASATVAELRQVKWVQ